MSSQIMDVYMQTPPMARTLATAIFVTSIFAHFGVLPYAWLYFTEDRLFHLPPEIWRLVTSFLLSSPQFGIILDPYFVYTYVSHLETSNPKFPRKEDALWYLITVGGIIITVNRLFLGNAFFLQGLTMALCYTATQDQRGAKAGFLFFTVPAQLMPYCMLLYSLLMNPMAIPLQLSGLFAAHLHDFLTRIWPEFGGGPNLLSTPAFVSKLVTTPRFLQREYGTAIRPKSSNQPSGGARGASTGSVFPDSWKTRGSGHRLG
ncbi:Der1-like family-domain-containing protein [Lasiosphaeria ovina]|uniref:Derlin n=1 Tax=Lasiosphaeria ovina TaxID=92902 RepID=A0AAE0KC45_9PEZI|nr:Der1-like family-domain-containing protein [Lasiosphaeria ovina]